MFKHKLTSPHYFDASIIYYSMFTELKITLRLGKVFKLCLGYFLGIIISSIAYWYAYNSYSENIQKL